MSVPRQQSPFYVWVVLSCSKNAAYTEVCSVAKKRGRWGTVTAGWWMCLPPGSARRRKTLTCVSAPPPARGDSPLHRGAVGLFWNGWPPSGRRIGSHSVAKLFLFALAELTVLEVRPQLNMPEWYDLSFPSIKSYTESKGRGSNPGQKKIYWRTNHVLGILMFLRNGRGAARDAPAAKVAKPDPPPPSLAGEVSRPLPCLTSSIDSEKQSLEYLYIIFTFFTHV